MSMATVNPNTSHTDPALSNLWRTPPALFARLNAEYGPFDVDAAANWANHLCPLFFGPGSVIAQDALTIAWGGFVEQPSSPYERTVQRPTRIFCNPPYGRKENACTADCRKIKCGTRGYHLTEDFPGMEAFIRKAHLEARIYNASTTLLVPATVEVPWFQQLVWDGKARAPRRGVLLEFPAKRVNFLRPDGTEAGSGGIGSAIITFLAGQVAA